MAYKINEQIVLSTEAMTWKLIRAITDWKAEQKENLDLQFQIETYLDGINRGSKEEDIHLSFLFLQQVIRACENALQCEYRIHLSIVNYMINDYNTWVAGSKYKRISNQMKLDGKLNIISYFKNIYHELKAEDRAVYAFINRKFIDPILEISKDVRIIYDQGLGREVRKESNLRKFFKKNKSNEQENQEKEKSYQVI